MFILQGITGFCPYAVTSSSESRMTFAEIIGAVVTIPFECNKQFCRVLVPLKLVFKRNPLMVALTRVLHQQKPSLPRERTESANAAP